MKTLLMLLLLSPALAFATKGSYMYSGITQVANGSDNFKLQQYNTVDREGTIVIAKGTLKIDDKEFRLKPTDDRKIYKVKGGIVKFVYEKGELVSVQLYQYNNLYHFDIAAPASIAGN